MNCNCHISTRWQADKSRQPDKSENWRRYYLRIEVSDEVMAIVSTIHGVNEVRAPDRYSIWVHRSPAFEWVEIHSNITDLLRFFSVEVNMEIEV